MVGAEHHVAKAVEESIRNKQGYSIIWRATCRMLESESFFDKLSKCILEYDHFINLIPTYTKSHSHKTAWLMLSCIILHTVMEYILQNFWHQLPQLVTAVVSRHDVERSHICDAHILAPIPGIRTDHPDVCRVSWPSLMTFHWNSNWRCSSQWIFDSTTVFTTSPIA